VWGDTDTNLTIFEEAADMGWVMENRFRPEGAASGYFPVLTMWQVRHVDNLGGYSTLLTVARAASCPSRAADGIKQAEEMEDEGAAQHTKWIGAEPYYTQAVARKGYTGATEDAEYAAYIGDQLLTGARQRQKRIQPPVNFRARFCEAEDDGSV
jgi:hypothetical protein